MATILVFLHPFSAFAASVKGIKINVTAADNNSKPKISRSYQVRRRIATTPRRRFDLGLIRFNLLAFRWFNSSDRPKGRKDAGKIIDHMP